ncbi:hypothetical protein B0T26DRAFT_167393 [Lasiosphaeria miniovina]|uniref:Uncharacterized protein n=1 Tax=Lasiosphaeria miniovina TaxID=1954250 RepID=A0AA40E7V7_9PEZI|nr:uncharacterized protein B0T26DRAFT_167393 [Lasiosphaeria miniovina]KAK0728347.1 hypothetical protein B0T26DRAFT_167393 [Lasiosphaeria miniovina]
MLLNKTCRPASSLHSTELRRRNEVRHLPLLACLMSRVASVEAGMFGNSLCCLLSNPRAALPVSCWVLSSLATLCLGVFLRFRKQALPRSVEQAGAKGARELGVIADHIRELAVCHGHCTCRLVHRVAMLVCTCNFDPTLFLTQCPLYPYIPDPSTSLSSTSPLLVCLSSEPRRPCPSATAGAKSRLTRYTAVLVSPATPDRTRAGYTAKLYISPHRSRLNPQNGPPDCGRGRRLRAPLPRLHQSRPSG